MKKALSIFINQIGYTPDSKKIAFVRESENKNANEFFVENISEKVVFKGKLTTAPEDPLTGETILLADFSELTEHGTYTVVVGKNKSLPVHIGQNLYGTLFDSTLKYFYLSRCGQEIEGGKWSHAACHTGIAEVYETGEQKQVIGGWHDAGDYGRYIVPGVKAVMDLLLAYDACKEFYNRFDILSEVRFELEWMLQLQREDGGVYHKISCYHFCPFISPEEEKDKLVLAPVSTSATADFAGCLAFASKYYATTDAEFATKLVNAAKKAQKYLDTHEDELYKNPQEITTGGYGDLNVKDERYFALCALFEVTENAEYLKKALEVKQQALAMPEDKEHPWFKNWIDAFTWACVSGYGTEILFRNLDKVKKALGDSAADDVKKVIVLRAEKVLDVCSKSSFGMALKFVQWGSNGYMCDEAHFLLLAHEITGDQKYIDAAKQQVNYLLGCNPFGICYVTGNGVYKTEHPHHRPSGAVGKAMPGMLAGGPSAGLQDATAKEMCSGKPANLCYIDKVGSYSTNEIAIYWNSAFVHLLAKLNCF